MIKKLLLTITFLVINLAIVSIFYNPTVFAEPSIFKIEKNCNVFVGPKLCEIEVIVRGEEADLDQKVSIQLTDDTTGEKIGTKDCSLKPKLGTNITECDVTFSVPLESGEHKFSAVLVSSPTSSPTSGQNPCVGGICNTALGNISTDPTTFVGRILRIATGLAGGLALILMVTGSIRVLTSSGDQQRLAAGRDMIVAAIAGLLFLIFSVLILKFIGVKIIDIPFV